jgi:hypothetical protein
VRIHGSQLGTFASVAELLRCQPLLLDGRGFFETAGFHKIHNLAQLTSVEKSAMAFAAVEHDAGTVGKLSPIHDGAAVRAFYVVRAWAGRLHILWGGTRHELDAVKCFVLHIAQHRFKQRCVKICAAAAVASFKRAASNMLGRHQALAARTCP